MDRLEKPAAHLETQGGRLKKFVFCAYCERLNTLVSLYISCSICTALTTHQPSRRSDQRQQGGEKPALTMLWGLLAKRELARERRNRRGLGAGAFCDELVFADEAISFSSCSSI
jgi:hypothetical protein